MKDFLLEKGIARFEEPGLVLLAWFDDFWRRRHGKEEAELLVDLTVLNATELCLINRASATQSLGDLPLVVEQTSVAGALWKTDTALMFPNHTARRIAHGRPADIRVWDGFFFTGDAQKTTQVLLNGPGDLRFTDLQGPDGFALYKSRLEDGLESEAIARLSAAIPPLVRELGNLLARLRILLAYRGKAKAKAIDWPREARAVSP
jgi:hypothetical protein